MPPLVDRALAEKLSSSLNETTNGFNRSQRNESDLRLLKRDLVKLNKVLDEALKVDDGPGAAHEVKTKVGNEKVTDLKNESTTHQQQAGAASFGGEKTGSSGDTESPGSDGQKSKDQTQQDNADLGEYSTLIDQKMLSELIKMSISSTERDERMASEFKKVNARLMKAEAKVDYLARNFEQMMQTTPSLVDKASDLLIDAKLKPLLKVVSESMRVQEDWIEHLISLSAMVSKAHTFAIEPSLSADDTSSSTSTPSTAAELKTKIEKLELTLNRTKDNVLKDATEKVLKIMRNAHKAKVVEEQKAVEKEKKMLKSQQQPVASTSKLPEPSTTDEPTSKPTEPASTLSPNVHDSSPTPTTESKSTVPPSDTTTTKVEEASIKSESVGQAEESHEGGEETSKSKKKKKKGKKDSTASTTATTGAEQKEKEVEHPAESSHTEQTPVASTSAQVDSPPQQPRPSTPPAPLNESLTTPNTPPSPATTTPTHKSDEVTSASTEGNKKKNKKGKKGKGKAEEESTTKEVTA